MSELEPVPAERYKPFVYVFVPFSLILATANIFYSELSPSMLFGTLFYPDTKVHLPGATTNTTLGRVVVTILTSFVFAIPALLLFFLYDMRKAPTLIYRYWQLFWTFGFLAYLAHCYFTVVVWFEADFNQIVEKQSLEVTIVNFALLFLWGFDVLVSVFRGQGRGGAKFYWFEWFTHLLFVAAAVTSSVIFASDFRTVGSRLLGWLIIGVCSYALLVRLIWGPVNKS